MDGYIYIQPLYPPEVHVPHKGVHKLIFAATTDHDSIYTFHADRADGG